MKRTRNSLKAPNLQKKSKHFLCYTQCHSCVISQRAEIPPLIIDPSYPFDDLYQRDDQKDSELGEAGFRVVRFKDEAVLHHIDLVILQLEEVIEEICDD